MSGFTLFAEFFNYINNLIGQFSYWSYFDIIISIFSLWAFISVVRLIMEVVG